ncbi:MAG: diadenylate cyclase CdaA [Clostridiales bacterium]|nr:diadenylate cyclase CdaA [Clostridiales bacterium]
MREMAASLYAVIDKYLYWFNLPKITVKDIIEIIIIAFVLYEIMAWIKNTRAWNLLKGIIVILVFLVVAAVLQMNIILWLVGKLASIAVIALVIIFQPELRNALESLGKRNFLSRWFNFDALKDNSTRFSEKTVSELVRACNAMGKEKTGALIVIERNVQLKEYIRTGIPLDSLISSQLLINIFEHNTPLHDGAIIVSGDRIVAATCYLPLSDNMELSKELGTRHRAAVGISEVSDSLTIVVSEETGAISLAMEGTLYHDVDNDFLKSKLKYAARLTVDKSSFMEKVRRKLSGSSGNKKDDPSPDQSQRRAKDA